ncbi:MAG: GatB/YqeY domain-containing protein [Thiomonas sp.]|jgi:uncharacterized protein YqeY
MTLKDRIQDDMKAAMRAKDTALLGTIRLLMAAMKQKEVDERITLDDAAVIAIIDKMIKQRRDAIAQFAAAGRQDLVDKDSAEIAALERYLPERLDAEAIDAEIRALMAQTGASRPQDLGKLMGPLKARLAGRADMGLVAARAKALLADA